MKRFRVKKGPFSLSSGRVELTEEQYLSRALSLDRLGDGVFQVVGRIEFKTGEELGIEGEICKALLEDLDVSSEEEDGQGVPLVDLNGFPGGGVVEFDEPLETLTDEQLLKIAEEFGLKDYEHLSREELIKVILSVGISGEEDGLDAPLETLSDDQLLKIAEEYSVKDYEHLSREELIEAIAKIEEAGDE